MKGNEKGERKERGRGNEVAGSMVAARKRRQARRERGRAAEGRSCRAGEYTVPGDATVAQVGAEVSLGGQVPATRTASLPLQWLPHTFGA